MTENKSNKKIHAVQQGLNEDNQKREI